MATLEEILKAPKLLIKKGAWAGKEVLVEDAKGNQDEHFELFLTDLNHPGLCMIQGFNSKKEIEDYFGLIPEVSQGKFNYDELNAKSTEALEKLKVKELERISSNEEYRQRLIGSIIALQNIETNLDFGTRKINFKF